MTNPDEAPASHGGRLYWLLPFVLLLYVLSIGPAARVCRGNAQFIRALQVFYYPVIALHDHTPLKKPLEQYVEFWGVN